MHDLPPPVAALSVTCAWCGRWRDAAGRWQTTPAEPDRRVSHGICPDCFAGEIDACRRRAGESVYAPAAAADR